MRACRRIRIFVIRLSLLGMIGLSGCSLIMGGSSDGLQTPQESQGSEENVVSATGDVVPGKEATLSFNNRAYDIRILVRPVAKGLRFRQATPAPEVILPFLQFHLDGFPGGDDGTIIHVGFPPKALIQSADSPYPGQPE